MYIHGERRIPNRNPRLNGAKGETEYSISDSCGLSFGKDHTSSRLGGDSGIFFDSFARIVSIYIGVLDRGFVLYDVI